MKEREAPENVEARLVRRTGFLGHTLQYGQMRSHFRSWRGFPTGCNVILDELDCGTDLETLRDFTSVSSDFYPFYPDLASHYARVIEEWYSGHEQTFEES